MTVVFPVTSAYELWSIAGCLVLGVFVFGGLVERIRKDKYVLKEVHETCILAQTTAITDIKNSINKIEGSIVSIAKWAETAINNNSTGSPNPPMVPFILS